MVYFIRGMVSGSIKIGFSYNPKGRLATLRTGSAEPMEMIGVIDGDQDEEAVYHEIYKHLRIRGEWFKPGPDLLEEVRRLFNPTLDDLIGFGPWEVWRIEGETLRGNSDCADMTLLLVRIFQYHYDMYGGPGRIMAAFPDPHQVVEAVYPDRYLSGLHSVENVTRRPERWAMDPESLRAPLTGDGSFSWACDTEVGIWRPFKTPPFLYQGTSAAQVF